MTREDLPLVNCADVNLDKFNFSYSQPRSHIAPNKPEWVQAEADN